MILRSRVGRETPRISQVRPLCLFQLAGVPRPIVGLQTGEGRVADPRRRLSEALADVFEQSPGESRDVLAPLDEVARIRRVTSVKTVVIDNQAIKPGVGGPQASSGGSGADAVQRMESVRRQLRDAPATSDRQVVQALEVSQPTVSETRKCIWESVDAIEVIRFTDPPGPRVAARLEANHATPRPHTPGSHGVLLARR